MHKPKIKKFALQGPEMLSPGVMHARKFEPVEWIPPGTQESRAYPASYEEARRCLVSLLLSMPAAPLEESNTAAVPRDRVTDIPDFELRRDRQRSGKSATIKGDSAGGKQRELQEFCYVSSFDCLTSKKRKAGTQPTRLPMGVHLLNVLTVTAGLVVGAFVYASAGGGFPGLSAGVRSFLGHQVAKVRLILPGHDVGTLPAAPAPMPLPTVKEASNSDHLLYSAASIAFTPVK